MPCADHSWPAPKAAVFLVKWHQSLFQDSPAISRTETFGYRRVYEIVTIDRPEALLVKSLSTKGGAANGSQEAQEVEADKESPESDEPTKARKNEQVWKIKTATRCRGTVCLDTFTDHLKVGLSQTQPHQKYSCDSPRSSRPYGNAAGGALAEENARRPLSLCVKSRQASLLLTPLLQCLCDNCRVLERALQVIANCFFSAAYSFRNKFSG
jgi:hypothetical protein